jgi:hypothetical protein
MKNSDDDESHLSAEKAKVLSLAAHLALRGARRVISAKRWPVDRDPFDLACRDLMPTVEKETAGLTAAAKEAWIDDYMSGLFCTAVHTIGRRAFVNMLKRIADSELAMIEAHPDLFP